MNRALAAMINGGMLSVLVTAAFWIVLRLIPRRVLNAATRYVLWWAVLVITAALPAIYLPGPSMGVAAHQGRSLTVTAPMSRSVWREDLAVRRKAFAPTVEPPAVFPIRVPSFDWPRWILMGWAAVSGLLLLRLIVSYWLLARTSARALEATATLRSRAVRWAQLCGAAGRGVRLAGSDEIASPVAVGPRRPSILIPAAMLRELGDAELDQIGLHEAAHLARRDDYALLAQRIVEAIFAFHPVVRWIARQIDLEREIACDDLVIRATGRPRAYALCLTRVVELSGGVRSALAAAPVADDRSHLARRIDMLLDKTRHTGTQLLKARLVAMFALIAALGWMAGRSPVLVAFATPIAQQVARHLPLPVLAPRVVAEAPQEAPPEFEARVVDDASGDPLVSAEVRFRKANQRELAADLDTDREGRVRAPGLPPGDYSVVVAKPNFVSTSLKVHLPSGPMLVRMVRHGVIGGRVTDAQGNPGVGRIISPGGRTAGGARITVMSNAEGGGFHTERTVELEEGGTYRIHDLPPGQYAVGLWYDGLKDGSGVQLYPDNAHPRFFSVAGGEEYRNIDFQLTSRPVFRVTGRVEQPKPKMRFSLALGLPEQPLLPIAQAIADTDGSFQFERVPPGTYDLFAAGPDAGYGAHETLLGPEPFYGRTRVQVNGQNVEGLQIAVSAGRSVSVTVGKAGAAPPEGCPQSISVGVEYLEPWGLLATNSMQAGFGKEQSFPNLPPGRVRLNAGGLGAQCYQASPAIADAGGSATIELAPAGSIRGKLRADSGNVAGFAVVLLDATASATSEAQLAFPDAQGRFAFDALRPGRYRIAAQPASEAKARWVGDVSRMTEVEIRGGPPTAVELTAAAKGGR